MMVWWLFSNEADAQAAQDAVFATLGPDMDGDAVAANQVTTCWDVPRQDVNGSWAIWAKAGFPLPEGAVAADTIDLSEPVP